jgi:hypothetical protein
LRSNVRRQIAGLCCAPELVEREGHRSSHSGHLR